MKVKSFILCQTPHSRLLELIQGIWHSLLSTNSELYLVDSLFLIDWEVKELRIMRDRLIATSITSISLLSITMSVTTLIMFLATKVQKEANLLFINILAFSIKKLSHKEKTVKIHPSGWTPKNQILISTVFLLNLIIKKNLKASINNKLSTVWLIVLLSL